MAFIFIENLIISRAIFRCVSYCTSFEMSANDLLIMIKQLDSIDSDAELIEKANMISNEIYTTIKHKKPLYVEYLEFCVFFGQIQLITMLLEAGCATNEKLLEIAYDHKNLIIYRILLYFRCAISAKLEDQIHDDNEPEYMVSLIKNRQTSYGKTTRKGKQA